METIRGVVFIYWHWFVFAALLGTVEILAPGIFFLWLALAAFITGVIALLIPGLGAAGQLVSFGVLAILMVVLAWKFLKRNPITSEQPLLNQRAAQYVGKSYALESAIVGGTGRIRINDSSWKVTGADAPTGTLVRVTGHDDGVLKAEIVGLAVVTSAVTATSPDSMADVLKDPLDRKD